MISEFACSLRSLASLFYVLVIIIAGVCAEVFLIWIVYLVSTQPSASRDIL